MKVPYFVPAIGTAEINEVEDTLRSFWLTSGPKMAEFERRFAASVGAERALAVGSCTAALHLSLVASGVGPGDEVIVPTMTFAATSAVVIHTGAKPVLVDIDPETLLIDPTAVELAITPRTKAIIPVHYGGQACDLDTLGVIARRNDLLMIEDAAHAFPSEYRDNPIGSIGDMTCFSFYANKTLTTGEGGMITLRDGTIADRLARLRLHGLDREAWQRYQGSTWDYDIAEPGYKYNLTDIAAAIGLSQLERADELWKKRSIIANRYAEGLAGIEGISPLAVLPDRKHSWHLFVLKIDPLILGIGRNAVIDRLGKVGIGTSVHYRPLHMHSYYEETLDLKPEDFPVATEAFSQVISLPIFPDLDGPSIEYVIEQLRLLADL